MRSVKFRKAFEAARKTSQLKAPQEIEWAFTIFKLSYVQFDISAPSIKAEQDTNLSCTS